MADTGEPFNVARRKVEAAAAGQVPEGANPYQLIEVEVGSDADLLDADGNRVDRRHVETFGAGGFSRRTRRRRARPSAVISLRARITVSRRPAWAASLSTRESPVTILPLRNSTTTTPWMMLSCPQTSKARWMPRWASGRSFTATSDLPRARRPIARRCVRVPVERPGQRRPAPRGPARGRAGLPRPEPGRWRRAAAPRSGAALIY